MLGRTRDKRFENGVVYVQNMKGELHQSHLTQQSSPCAQLRGKRKPLLLEQLAGHFFLELEYWVAKGMEKNLFSSSVCVSQQGIVQLTCCFGSRLLLHQVNLKGYLEKLMCSL